MFPENDSRQCGSGDRDQGKGEARERRVGVLHSVGLCDEVYDRLAEAHEKKEPDRLALDVMMTASMIIKLPVKRIESSMGTERCFSARDVAMKLKPHMPLAAMAAAMAIFVLSFPSFIMSFPDPQAKC